VKTAVVNARISRRSYPRYRLARPIFRHVLETVDRFGVQTDEWRRQFVELGAPATHVVVTGSLKFDALDGPASTPDAGRQDDVLRFFPLPSGHPVLIAASTLRGEEEPVLEAFRRILATTPAARLIIAPRHPERFDAAHDAAVRAGFHVSRRSELTIDEAPASEVVILDTIGELARLYRMATVVFVGGSLVEAGGHNILEPAVFGKPIVFGPHMDNFGEIADLFLTSDAACQIQSSQELATVLEALFADASRRRRLGTSAQTLVDAHRGATARSLKMIAELLPPER
jgi:3-deoxy-D-manno-octulosonic-acid transferase